ncbi:peptide MFS transporter [Asticcacaulis sp. 201]|uniref:peptide MFS transporter n=1 Tax=Asticcacaulis sp. 201 TaxID=3028787 RepID=UPI002915D4A3|nr:peptide MFS transporter [Asticcacaulis sp. 201]MDV6330957.1 peptide MFS transporter [Asticcacaulis sp. 201]
MSKDDFMGHPKGLAYIAFTEAWERFSFYGMQALLMLYMTGRLLKPGVVDHVWGFSTFQSLVESVTGPLSVQALAAQIFGIYVALVYFGPVVGGLVGDRLIGRTPAVLTGALLLAIGHFLMAFEPAFLPALGCIICGAGLLKGNLAAQVGALYPEGDRRIDDGYTLYITSVVVGAFVSPLVCGTLGELYGWHYGFGAAGVGMLVGIGIYLRGLKHFKEPAKKTEAQLARMTRAEWGRIGVLCGLILITSLFWTVQSQIWNTYPVWLRDDVSLGIGFGLSIPVTWFQSLDAFAVLALTPVTMAMWKALGKRGLEPTDIVKLAIGCALFGGGCLLLSVGQWVAGSGKVAVVWPLVFHFVIGAGYLLCSPVALALVARSAPVQVKSMMVGGYYIGLFIAGIFSGWLGRFYEPLHPPLFWLLHAGIGLAGTLILLALYAPLRRILLPKPV